MSEEKEAAVATEEKVKEPTLEEQEAALKAKEAEELEAQKVKAEEEEKALREKQEKEWAEAAEARKLQREQEAKAYRAASRPLQQGGVGWGVLSKEGDFLFKDSLLTSQCVAEDLAFALNQAHDARPKVKVGDKLV